jgi:SAM-dependent methyltransferase
MPDSVSNAGFDELVAEGESADVTGWDFAWFDGRASEERPPWGYAAMLGERMAGLAGVPGAAALDLQTGGGEVLATIPAWPHALAATEAWPPNIARARRNLARVGARVVPVADELADLPFANAAFDLVVSRHPVAVRWDEIARVLKPGGSYLSQDVGDGSVRELTEFMMGPQPADDGPTRDPRWSVAGAEAAGLTVTDLREFRGRMEFGDVAAVVHFLRKVIWIVPGFSVEAYRDRLRALHERIESAGPFAATSVRFLIEARKEPGPTGVPTGIPAGAALPKLSSVAKRHMNTLLNQNPHSSVFAIDDAASLHRRGPSAQERR